MITERPSNIDNSADWISPFHSSHANTHTEDRVYTSYLAAINSSEQAQIEFKLICVEAGLKDCGGGTDTELQKNIVKMGRTLINSVYRESELALICTQVGKGDKNSIVKHCEEHVKEMESALNAVIQCSKDIQQQNLEDIRPEAPGILQLLRIRRPSEEEESLQANPLRFNIINLRLSHIEHRIKTIQAIANTALAKANLELIKNPATPGNKKSKALKFKTIDIQIMIDDYEDYKQRVQNAQNLTDKERLCDQLNWINDEFTNHTKHSLID